LDLVRSGGVIAIGERFCRPPAKLRIIGRCPGRVLGRAVASLLRPEVRSERGSNDESPHRNDHSDHQQHRRQHRSASCCGASGACGSRSRLPVISYVVVYKEQFGGQHWNYTIRIEKIVARGLRCRAARTLIRRADTSTTHRNVGQYVPIPPWQCRMFRPFGGPNNFMWLEDCKGAGGHRLSWTEHQLHATRIS
jgi:hypothetical protein